MIEEHSLTETLINEKLKSEQSQQKAIESMIQQQLQKLTKDQLSIKQITSQIDIDLEQVLQTNGNQYIESQLNNYYTTSKPNNSIFIAKSTCNIFRD